MRSVKFAALIVAGTLAAGAFASCGNRAKNAASDGTTAGSEVSAGEDVIVQGVNDSAENAVKSYAKAAYDSIDGEIYCTLTLPQKDISKLKSGNDSWKKKAENYAKNRKEELERDGFTKSETADFMQDTALSATALKNAETYFVQTYGGDKPKASEGYGYTFIITSTKGGETLKSGLEVSAVNFEGQGWKILPFDAESLEKSSK